MHPSHPMQINLNYPTICNKTPLPLVVLSGGICVICNLGFVGVLLRICWICVFGFLSGVGRRTVCGENDGRIGVCITAKLDCIVFTVFHCSAVHWYPMFVLVFTSSGGGVNILVARDELNIEQAKPRMKMKMWRRRRTIQMPLKIIQKKKWFAEEANPTYIL